MTGTTNIIREHTEFGIQENDLPALRSAISNILPGQTLTLPRDMVFEIPLNEPLVIDKPMKLTGGYFQGPSNMIEVQHDDVILEDLIAEGLGSDLEHHVSGARAILVQKPSGETLYNFAARGITVRNVAYSGIHGIGVTNFLVEDCDVRHFRYSGISFSQSHHGLIYNNVTKHGVSDESVNNNSYGIYTSCPASASLERRPSHITIENNLVEDIPHWEGIDTHNGQHISIINNVVRGCRRGIALVSNMDIEGSGPSNVLIQGNLVDGAGHSKEIFNDDRGISVGGNPDKRYDTDSVTTSNTIINYEQPIYFRIDRPNLYRWDKMVVSNNATDKPSHEVPSTEHLSLWGSSLDFLDHRNVEEDSTHPLLYRLETTRSGWNLEIQGKFTFLEDGRQIVGRLPGSLATRHLVPKELADGTVNQLIVGIAYSEYGQHSPVFLKSNRILETEFIGHVGKVTLDVKFNSQGDIHG